MNDFIAAVAASFRAPIGGVLFTLEEAFSPSATSNVAKSFCCAVVTFLTVSIVTRTLNKGKDEVSSYFSFGKFSDVSVDGVQDYYLYDLGGFLLVGLTGGLFGGLFVILTSWLFKYRNRNNIGIGYNLGKRFAEVMIVCMATAWLTFTVPIIWSVCTTIPNTEELNLSTDEEELVADLVQYNCPHGTYNEAASLLFVDYTVSIRMLFHHRERVAAQTFSLLTLTIVFVPYFLFSIYTNGITACLGSFVPLLISGALMGRMIGVGLHVAFPNYIADSGTYALVGAASFLGGSCRNLFRYV